MAKRYPYDLSHYSFMSGKIGRLMTLSVIPVVAGDSMGINLAGAIRLSPLRRDLALDAMVDLFGFYVPHRHVYGDDWISFIQGGHDENVTLTSIPVGGTPPQYLGYNNLTGNVPAWLIHGYNMIWNRYFRVPNGQVAELPLANDASSLQQTVEGLNFGQLCARLKTLPTTGHRVVNSGTQETDNPDNIYSATVQGATARIDLAELDRQRGRHKTELERHWFGRRYTDILERVYGGYASSDADQRPTLLMRESQWLSGYDVDGSADANLGQYAGKAASVMDMNIPGKFFPEHGALWLMALVRFPTIFEKEVHYLVRRNDPTYPEIAGDPDIIANRQPHTLFRQNLFTGVASTDTTSLGYHPFGQWYRYHPSVIHNRFDELSGFPFIPYVPANHTAAQYHQGGDYDRVFATSQLGHWRSQFRVNAMVKRVVPGPLSSIYTGV